MADKYAFNERDAGRIARVVRQVEAGNRDATAITFRGAGSSMPPSFRIATFGSAAWNVDTARTVTLFHVTNTPNTVSVSNVFGDIGTATSTSRKCAIARDGTAWFVIQARCP